MGEVPQAQQLRHPPQLLQEKLHPSPQLDRLQMLEHLQPQQPGEDQQEQEQEQERPAEEVHNG